MESMNMTFKENDWCIYGLNIVQIITMEPYVEYSTGYIRGSNATKENLRPLTLRNKVIVESMDGYYEALRYMDGSGSFNFPDISQYFAEIARNAMDGDDKASDEAFKKAQHFVSAARDLTRIIDGVRLFRPSLSRRA